MGAAHCSSLEVLGVGAPSLIALFVECALALLCGVGAMGSTAQRLYPCTAWLCHRELLQFRWSRLGDATHA